MTTLHRRVLLGERDASEVLDREVSAIDFAGGRLHLIFGYHRSDVGKAQLVSRLGLLLDGGFSILKFDGFLNTNCDGRYPSHTHHDFVVYRRFHNHIGFGGPNQILGGPLLMEFLGRFGESKEHLMFRPHVAQFFARRVFEKWIELGTPSDLLVEIGGTFHDLEVEAYVVPGLRMLREQGHAVRTFLLTEAGYSGEAIKAKPVITALTGGLQCGLVFDLVLARIPPDCPQTSDCSDLSSYIESRIADSLIYGGRSPKVICVPYYADSDLSGYTEYLGRYRHIIFPTVGGVQP